MTEKTTGWIVLFHHFDKEGNFVSANLFDFCVKAGKEHTFFSLLASHCQSGYEEWKNWRCKDLKECLDIADDKWDIVSLLLGELRDPRYKNRLVSFARVD